MSSVVEICNKALSSIRAKSINSLDENSVSAQQCKLVYDKLRDQALAGAPWQFSGKVRALSRLDKDVFGWTYVYAYPSDCLYINRLIPKQYGEFTGYDEEGIHYRPRDPLGLRPDLNDFQVEYNVMNVDGKKVIVSNYDDLYIDYRSRITDPTLFDINFELALSHLIASELAIVLVGAEMGRQLRQDEVAMYQQFLRQASTLNANQRYTLPNQSDYIKARS